MKKQAETYAIINITDLGNIEFSQIGETNQNTIRKSVDQTQFVIKWNAEPSFISDGTVTPLQTLTHLEALALMATDDWTAYIETK